MKLRLILIGGIDEIKPMGAPWYFLHYPGVAPFFRRIALRGFKPFTLNFLRIGIAAFSLLAVLGAALCYSFARIFGKRFKKIPPVVNSCGMLLCTTLILLPLLISLDAPRTVRPSFEALTAVIPLAIISTALADLIYFHLLTAVGATYVLLMTFFIPISALVLGAGVLGEVIRVFEICGTGCIFPGLMIIGRYSSGLQRPVVRTD